MNDLFKVEFQLYSDSKMINLLQKIMQLWHFQALWGKKWKAEKMDDITNFVFYFDRSIELVYNYYSKCNFLNFSNFFMDTHSNLDCTYSNIDFAH